MASKNILKHFEVPENLDSGIFKANSISGNKKVTSNYMILMKGKQYSLFKSYQQNKGKGEKLSETKSSVSFSASGGKSQQESTVSTTTASSVVRSKLLSSGIRNEPSSTTGTTAKSPVTPLVAAAPPIAPPASSKPSADTGPAPATSSKTSSNSIIVNYRQRGNPILKHIRNVPWEYGSIIPDYVMGIANCALFLSLRYHQLHPEYLHNRLKELGKGYDLRVLLVQVDVKDPHHQLKDLAKICILADLTLILAFSPEEAGRYLEAYKVYENKSAEVLMEKTDTDYSSKLTECLTTVKSVNKTDSMTLLSAFKSMKGIINASKEDISLCAGFGPQKAQRLYDVFHEPFVKGRKRHVETNSDSNDFSRPKKNPP